MPIRSGNKVDSPILLNRTAAEIFELAKKCHSREQIVEHLLQKYELYDNDSGLLDINSAIDTLLACGLLEE